MKNKAKILLVDDEPELLKAMHRMLKDDFDVVMTSQCHEVFRLMRTDSFAVLIVDLVMPDLSGLEILQRVKQMSPATEVIIVTGYASVRTTKQALRAGAYDYLERPFARAEIHHVIRNAVIHHELNKSEESGEDATDPAQTMVLLLERIRQLEDQLTQEEVRTFQNTVELLYQLIGARQHDMMMHLHSVEDYALPVARRLGFDEGEKTDLQVAAAFHDIGKLAVDEAVLYKPGPLNKEEWEVMRQHPVIGARIVGTVKGWENAADGVLYHQERVDGNGYPEGLSGKQIPIIARIVTVADAYDAMTSERAYKTAISRQEAIQELEDNKGTQFDPEVVDAFVSII